MVKYILAFILFFLMIAGLYFFMSSLEENNEGVVEIIIFSGENNETLGIYRTTKAYNIIYIHEEHIDRSLYMMRRGAE